MGRGVGRWRVLVNLGFVAAVLALAGFGAAQVARRQWRVQPTFLTRAEFATVGGVEVGHRVRIQGMDAGVVQALVPPAAPGAPVVLVFRVDERLRPLVRADAVARIVAEGVVGGKVVEIVPGKADAPPLPPDGSIASERPLELADVMRKASLALDRLDAVAQSAEVGLGEVNAIAAAVRKGEGSLGKFVRDDDAYQRLVGLSSRGEKTLGDLEENLAALKQTWPISRYFNDRAFYDRDRVLFRPGSVRDSRSLREEDLFERGRSVLTARGRAQLDGVASWFARTKRPDTEVVVAAFTDDARDPGLAQALTQEQAEAVRKYLVDRHAIAANGWFSARKVAAVGFGLEQPRSLEGGGPPLPGRRVDVILFTPQA